MKTKRMVRFVKKFTLFRTLKLGINNEIIIARISLHYRRTFMNGVSKSINFFQLLILSVNLLNNIVLHNNIRKKICVHKKAIKIIP